MSKSSRRSSLGSENSFVSGDDGHPEECTSETPTQGSREESNHPAIPVTKSHAAFVSKLYNMVEDQEIQHLISWSGNGELFRVYNPTTFSKNVLPQYFKHNNWQSFVRQLNMYGFNKVNDMIHSNLKNENQTWEFRHPNFRQGCIDDLRNIKRKSVRSLRATAPLPPSSTFDPDSKADVYHREYSIIEDRLNHITRGHNAMQEEFASLRFVVGRQQEIIEELVSLLENIRKPVSADASSPYTPNPMTSYANIREKIGAIQTQLHSMYEHSAASQAFTPMVDAVQQAPPPPPNMSPLSQESFPPITVAPINDATEPLPNLTSGLPLGSMIPTADSSMEETTTTITPYSQENAGIPHTQNRSKSAIMGLGKESYLLNPADDEADQDTKRRRSSPP